MTGPGDGPPSRVHASDLPFGRDDPVPGSYSPGPPGSGPSPDQPGHTGRGSASPPDQPKEAGSPLVEAGEGGGGGGASGAFGASRFPAQGLEAPAAEGRVGVSAAAPDDAGRRSTAVDPERPPLDTAGGRGVRSRAAFAPADAGGDRRRKPR